MGGTNDVGPVPSWIKAVMVISILFIIVLLLGRFGGKKGNEEKIVKEVIPELVSAPETNTINRVKEVIPKKRKTSERQATQNVVVAQADINQALVFARRKQAEAKEKTESNQDFNPGKEGLIRLDR